MDDTNTTSNAEPIFSSLEQTQYHQYSAPTIATFMFAVEMIAIVAIVLAMWSVTFVLIEKLRDTAVLFMLVSPILLAIFLYLAAKLQYDFTIGFFEKVLLQRKILARLNKIVESGNQVTD